MKLRDAERIAKATSALFGRVKGARAKLETAEKRALAALDAIIAANTDLSEAFTRWSELVEELDPDGEIDAPIEETDVLVNIDDLAESIEGAFEVAAEFEAVDELFEEIIKSAEDYEEPEEEDDDKESTFTCDHPGCKAVTGDDSVAEAKARGWEIRAERTPGGGVNWVSYCPKHRE